MTDFARWLHERDAARDHGDALAVAVDAFLRAPETGTDGLREALAAYVTGEGWNGPAGRWTREEAERERVEREPEAGT